MENFAENNTTQHNLQHQVFFKETLLQWFKNKPPRFLPWKEGKLAYRIWLAEIMLQQTRVEQGLPYYLKFIEHFPTVEDLASASEDEVLKLWQGLGYYARARNLHYTAQYIADECNGVFPSTYEEIRALKGVGDYTAAAISSFAYNLPYAVVDGNVYRVLARFFGIHTAIDSTEGKKLFKALAQSLLVIKEAANYNQAIMDFGALVCTPKQTKCNNCVFRKHCQARSENTVGRLPHKAKKLKKKNRYFNYLIWQSPQKELILQKRSTKDIWQGLYEFPLVESSKLVEQWSLKMLMECDLWKGLKNDGAVQIHQQSSYQKQILSHQCIHACFLELKGEIPSFFLEDASYEIVLAKDLKNFAVPKIIQDYLNNRQLGFFG